MLGKTVGIYAERLPSPCGAVELLYSHSRIDQHWYDVIKGLLCIYAGMTRATCRARPPTARCQVGTLSE
jgi:hypothetical protein